MATITITRSSEYTNAMRSYKIILDGKNAGKIGNGKSIDLYVEGGTHTLQFKVDWCGSQTITFDIKEDGEKEFHISAFRYSKTIMPVLLALVVVNILATTFFNFHYLNYIFFLVLPAMVYILTVGRNKYLTLEEVPTS